MQVQANRAKTYFPPMKPPPAAKLSWDPVETPPGSAAHIQRTTLASAEGAPKFKLLPVLTDDDIWDLWTNGLSTTGLWEASEQLWKERCFLRVCRVVAEGR